MLTKLLNCYVDTGLRTYCVETLLPRLPRIRRDVIGFGALGLLCLCLGFYITPQRTIEISARNALSSTETKTIRMGKTLPQSFESLDKDSILHLRSQIVDQHATLLATSYAPRPEVFESIGEKTPWFGLEGYYYYGIGSHSAKGPAASSREILNPFMLVSAEFFGLSIWDDGALNWKFEEVTPAHVASPNFPLYPELSEIVWNAAESQAVAFYKVSAFLEASAPYVKEPLTIADVRFSLNAINARDWGYDFIAVASEGINGIASNGPLDTIIANNQSYAPSDVCGLENGCIHSTDTAPELSSLSAKTLPSRIRIKLWRERPASAGEKADFEFTVGLI